MYFGDMYLVQKSHHTEKIEAIDLRQAFVKYFGFSTLTVSYFSEKFDFKIILNRRQLEIDVK